MSVIVSVVAENTSRVIDMQNIFPDMIAKQIDAVFEDITVDAVKNRYAFRRRLYAERLREKLKQYKLNNVSDRLPAQCTAKNGCPLMQRQAIETLIKNIDPA